MKKETATPLTDSYLQSLEGMQMPATDDFFYTRLRLRMEQPTAAWVLPVKPVWVVGSLLLLMGMNLVMLTRQTKTVKKEQLSSELQQVAATYGLGISSSY